MTKQEKLTRLLAKESVGFAAILVMLLWALWHLSASYDDYRQHSEVLENKVDALASAADSLRAKYDKARDETLYHEVLRKNGGTYANREMVKDAFRTFKDRYHLSGLHLAMSPLATGRDAGYRRASYRIVFSDAEVSFVAPSEEDAYGLLAAMDEELPGACKITRFSLRHATGEPAAGKNVAAPLRGEIHFQWMGIEPADAAAVAR
ncbi:MAG: hypothetical protein KGJ06_00525 [Pseudomonadota bacterium]|nr:hypothetical protein [Pseudomonadota bacterium]